jgi:hypothetical protein
MIMKQTFLAVALLGCGFLAGAQDSTDYNTMRTTLQSSTGNYNAYRPVTNVPTTTQGFLVRDYPTVTSPVWEQAGDWYRASSLNNNRNIMYYYAPNGMGYTVALPVLQSWIPEEVVTTALNSYGNNIYAINKVRAANGKEVYQVTVLENGQSRYEYIGMDGQPVTAVDVFLVPGVDMNQLNNNSSNAAKSEISNNQMQNNNDVIVNDMDNTSKNQQLKTKTKVKHVNGHEIKTKTKNGKTRVKESNPDNMDQ